MHARAFTARQSKLASRQPVGFAVGAVVGMALALRGGGAVIWSKSQDEFIYIKGVVSPQAINPH